MKSLQYLVLTLAVVSLVFTVLVLFGCQEVSRDKNNNGEMIPGEFNGKIKQFTTEKGVDCLFVKRLEAGGLSCNWEKYNEQQRAPDLRGYTQ